MTFEVIGFQILLLVLYATTKIVAYPGSDFEDIQRKDEDRFNEYAKDLAGPGFVDIEDGTGWTNETNSYNEDDEIGNYHIIGSAAFGIAVILVCCCCCCGIRCLCKKNKKGKVIKYQYSQRFTMLTRAEAIPYGWRLASIQDVAKHEEDAKNAISLEWGICTLADGRIKGPGYNFEVERGSFFDLGHKLVANISFDTPKMNHGITTTSSNHCQPTYYSVPTGPSPQTSTNENYPSSLGLITSPPTPFTTSSIPQAPSYSQHEASSVRSNLEPSPSTNTPAEDPILSIHDKKDTSSAPQEPYNPTFVESSSLDCDPPPAYSGDISNTPVIE